MRLIDQVRYNRMADKRASIRSQQREPKRMARSKRRCLREREEVLANSSAAEYFETYGGISPIPTEHPPSLRNPIDVKIPKAQDAWRKARTRKEAMEELEEIHRRIRRQTGKPVVAIVAPMVGPGWPY